MCSKLKILEAKVKNIRDLCVGKNLSDTNISIKGASWKGISIFQFSQLNLNYEYQFSRVVVSNILIIWLAGGEHFTTETEARQKSFTWSEQVKQGIEFMHTYAHPDVRAWSKTHKFSSTLNTHFWYILCQFSKRKLVFYFDWDSFEETLYIYFHFPPFTNDLNHRRWWWNILQALCIATVHMKVRNFHIIY